MAHHFDNTLEMTLSALVLCLSIAFIWQNSYPVAFKLFGKEEVEYIKEKADYYVELLRKWEGMGSKERWECH